MIGASSGKSKMRAVLVQARKPAPISASVASVRARTMEVLPLCTLPTSHTSGASVRAAVGDGSGGGSIAHPRSVLTLAARPKG